LGVAKVQRYFTETFVYGHIGLRLDLELPLRVPASEALATLGTSSLQLPHFRAPEGAVKVVSFYLVFPSCSSLEIVWSFVNQVCFDTMHAQMFGPRVDLRIGAPATAQPEDRGDAAATADAVTVTRLLRAGRSLPLRDYVAAFRSGIPVAAASPIAAPIAAIPRVASPGARTPATTPAAAPPPTRTEIPASKFPGGGVLHIRNGRIARSVGFRMQASLVPLTLESLAEADSTPETLAAVDRQRAESLQQGHRYLAVLYLTDANASSVVHPESLIALHDAGTGVGAVHKLFAQNVRVLRIEGRATSFVLEETTRGTAVVRRMAELGRGAMGDPRAQALQAWTDAQPQVRRFHCVCASADAVITWMQCLTAPPFGLAAALLRPRVSATGVSLNEVADDDLGDLSQFTLEAMNPAAAAGPEPNVPTTPAAPAEFVPDPVMRLIEGCFDPRGARRDCDVVQLRASTSEREQHAAVAPRSLSAADADGSDQTHEAHHAATPPRSGGGSPAASPRGGGVDFDGDAAALLRLAQRDWERAITAARSLVKLIHVEPELRRVAASIVESNDRCRWYGQRGPKPPRAMLTFSAAAALAAVAARARNAAAARKAGLLAGDAARGASVAGVSSAASITTENLSQADEFELEIEAADATPIRLPAAPAADSAPRGNPLVGSPLSVRDAAMRATPSTSPSLGLKLQDLGASDWFSTVRVAAERLRRGVDIDQVESWRAQPRHVPRALDVSAVSASATRGVPALFNSPRRSPARIPASEGESPHALYSGRSGRSLPIGNPRPQATGAALFSGSRFIPGESCDQCGRSYATSAVCSVTGRMHVMPNNAATVGFAYSSAGR
jgi:hypothetical protein